MSDNEGAKKPASLSELFLRVPGRPVMTEGLGRIVLYPPTLKTSSMLESQFGDDLGSAAAMAVFDRFLTLSATLEASEGGDPARLSAQEVALLTAQDKARLAAATLYEVEGDAKNADPEGVVGQVVRGLAAQSANLRASQRILAEKLKTIGLGQDSAARKAIEESLKHSEMIRRALGPVATIAASQPALDHILRWNSERAASASLGTPPFRPMPSPISPNLLRGVDFVSHAPIDPGKRVRENQARLEAAGEQVIHLAEIAVLRINELADVATRFQIESTASGRKNLGIALGALVLGTTLTLFQFGYQIYKDVVDGPKQDRQLQLLQEDAATEGAQVAALQMLVEETRRGRQPTEVRPATSAAGNSVSPSDHSPQAGNPSKVPRTR